MWGTDMTTAALATGKPGRRLREQKTIVRRSCVGLHAAERGTRFEALQPIRQGLCRAIHLQAQGKSASG